MSLRFVTAVFLLATSSLVFAQSQFSIYLDSDFRSSSGCSVVTQDGTLEGIDHWVLADTTTTQVTALSIAECDSGSVFLAPQPLTGPPWPIGSGLGINGASVIELAFDLQSLGNPARIRFGVQSEGNGIPDAVTNNGSGIILGVRAIPVPGLTGLGIGLGLLTVMLVALWVSRKQPWLMAGILCVGGIGVVWAFNIDGDPSDWGATPPLASDPNGDGDPDIQGVFAAGRAGMLVLRIDAFLNQPPVAMDDGPVSVDEDGTVNIDVAANDSDPDMDPLDVVSVSAPANGTATLLPDDTIDYTPDADYFGADTFTYTIEDDQGGSDTATVTMDVVSINDAPTFNVAGTIDLPKDGGAQSIPNQLTAISAGAANESGQVVSFNVSNDNNALFSVQPQIDSAGTLTFTSAADASGTATVTVTAMDDGGTANGGQDTSAPQDFVINIDAVNDPPSFTAGADQTVLEDAGAQSVAAWATAISAGPPDEAGQTVSFNITGNTNPALFAAGPAVDSSGTLTFTPATDANGSADITLVAQDNGGTANGGNDTSPPQTFTIDVTAVNDAPSFVAGGNVSVLEESGAAAFPGWATAITAGPADESGQALNFVVTGNTAPGLFSVTPAVAANGDLSFTPAADQVGTATVTIELADDGGTANGGVDTSTSATFDITVNGINDAPSFTAGPDQTVLEDAGAQSVPGWATAISAGPPDESGQTVSFVITNNTNAALFSSGPAVDSSGTLTYTTAADANGSADITLQAQDDGGTANGGVDTSGTQTFTINVTAVNDAPTFTAGPNVDRPEDSGAATTTGWATAISAGPADESGQSVTFAVTGNTNGALFSSAPDISSAGDLTFTPAANQSGTATITIELSDDGGTANGGNDTSASVMFDIIITDINDAPSFTAGADQTSDEDAGAQTVNGWATAISPGPASESGQTVSFNITGNTNAALFSAGPSVNSAGDLSYTAAANLSGSADITLEAQDDGGTANGGVDTSPAQTFTITITPTNDAPVLDAVGNQSVDELATLNFTATASDPSDSPADNLSFSLSGEPAGASITASGAFSWTPTEAQGPGMYTFDVVVTDDGSNPANLTDSETITVTVNEVNENPVLDAVGNQSGDELTTIMFTATASDTDLPAQNLTFSLSGEPSGAAITAGGAFSWTPTEAQGAPGMAGMYTFDVIVTDDGTGMLTDSETITVTANEVNANPVATDDSYSATGNVSISVPAGSGVLGNDSDSDLPAQTLTATVETVASTNGGSASIAADGSFTYEPPAGFTGDDTFVYTLEDGNSGTDTGTVTISVSEMIWFVDKTAMGTDAGTLADPFTTLAQFNAATTADGDCVFVAGSGDAQYTGPINLADNQRLIGQGASGTLAAQCGVTLAANSDALPALSGTRPVISTTTGTINGVGLGQSNRLRGFNVANTTGYALSGTAVGNLQVFDVAVTGTGGALDVSSSGTFGTAVTFDQLDCNTSATGCVNLVNVTGTLAVTNAGSGWTNGHTASMLRIVGSTLTFNYAGIGTNTNGRGLSIVQNPNVNITLSGVMTLSGPIQGIWIQESAGTVTVNNASSSINTSDRGINIQNSLAAGVNLSYAGGVTHTGNNFNAIRVSNNANGSLAVTGAVTINHTGATSISVENGGSVSLSNASNAITAANVTGLFIQNTDIGVAGVRFASLNQTAGEHAIRLNNTGTTGAFQVDSGSITNTTNHGVFLTDAHNVFLTNLTINGAGDTAGEHGVFSSGGSNHDFTNVDISNPQGAGWNIRDLAGGSNRFDGGSSVSSVNVSGFGFIDWTNDDVGTMASPAVLTINNATFENQASSNGNSVVDVTGAGTSEMTLNIENGTTFQNLYGNSINVGAGFAGGDTAVVNLNVSNTIVQNSSPNGIQTVGLGAVQNATLNLDVQTNNTMMNLAYADAGYTMPLALTAGIVQMQGFDTGAVIGTVRDIDMDTIGRRGLQMAPENSAATVHNLRLNANTIDDTHQEAKFVSTRNSAQLHLRIENNTVGSTVPVAQAGREGYEILSEDSSSLTALINNNTIINAPDGGTDEVVDIDAEQTSTQHMTFTNNTLTAMGSDDPTGEFEAEVDDVTASLCLDLRNNSASSTGTATYELDDDDGNVSAGSQNFVVENRATVTGDQLSGTVNINDVSIVVSGAACNSPM